MKEQILAVQRMQDYIENHKTEEIRLPEAEYLMFQGQPFREEDYCQAIRTVQAAMDGYDPSVVGYRWDDENPRIQLEPRGQRGYIELRAVRRLEQ